jgi:hypothetical protein
MRMRKIYLGILALLLCSASQSFGQLAGKSTFAFANVPPSARTTALGGNVLSSFKKDMSSSYQNPASLRTYHDKWLSLNYNNHLADIQYGYVGYAKNFDKGGMWAGGIFYIDYGTIDAYDETGRPLGTATAGEYAVQITHSKQVHEKLYLGGSFKYLYSVLDTDIGNGAAVDLGGTYEDSAKQFTASLVVRNLGVQIVKYTEDSEREPLPFGIHFGISKQLEHMPFRLHLLFHDLQEFDLTYKNSNVGSLQIDLETGDPIQEKSTFGDKIMRHVNIGGEFLFSKNFNLSFGYNHQKRKEMAPEFRKGVTGFSWGIGFRINKLHIGYASTAYFPGFNTNQFSVNINMDQLKKG